LALLAHADLVVPWKQHVLDFSLLSQGRPLLRPTFQRGSMIEVDGTINSGRFGIIDAVKESVGSAPDREILESEANQPVFIACAHLPLICMASSISFLFIDSSAIDQPNALRLVWIEGEIMGLLALCTRPSSFRRLAIINSSKGWAKAVSFMARSGPFGRAASARSHSDDAAALRHLSGFASTSSNSAICSVCIEPLPSSSSRPMSR
jgi:hypothetical protein